MFVIPVNKIDGSLEVFFPGLGFSGHPVSGCSFTELVGLLVVLLTNNNWQYINR